MSKIQIADLKATGNELFQGNESFLTELQSVEANAIYGGKKCTGKKKTGGKSSDGCKVGKSSDKSTGKSSNDGCGGPGPLPILP
jgi:hypothetical protein